MTRRGKVIPFPRTRPPEPQASGLVEVRRSRDQAEALVQSVHPFSVGNAGEVTLLVAAIDAERARRLLAQV